MRRGGRRRHRTKKLEQRVRKALWLKTDAPWEVTEYRLCRYVYHCTPSELREQDASVIQAHLMIARLEEELE